MSKLTATIPKIGLSGSPRFPLDHNPFLKMAPTWEFKHEDASIKRWSVPHTGDYRIVAVGARAADGRDRRGGRGARVEATFTLTMGDELHILCGGMSTKRDQGPDSGGGGELSSTSPSSRTTSSRSTSFLGVSSPNLLISVAMFALGI